MLFVNKQKYIKPQSSVKSKTKKILLAKQVNANTVKKLSQTEKLDTKLKSRKRWFRLFSDQEIFHKNFDDDVKSKDLKIWKSKKRDVKRIESNDDYLLKLEFQSNIKDNIETQENQSTDDRRVSCDKSDEKWYRTLIHSLFDKIATNQTRRHFADDDWNTEEDQITNDQTKLRCELLKSIKEQLPPVEEEDSS